MDVGLALLPPELASPGGPQRWHALAGVARAAEDAGFSTLWLCDQRPPALAGGPAPGEASGVLDPLVAAAALARLTTRARLGVRLRADLRPPVVLAKALATVDVLSEGRLVVALDDGDGPAGHLAELLEVLAGTLGGEPYSFDGRFYRADGVRSLPTPVQHPRPPLWVHGPLTAERSAAVARLADGWVGDPASVDEHRQADGVLAAALRASGREPGSLARAVTLRVGTTDAGSDLTRRVETWAALATSVIVEPEVLATADDVALLAQACSLRVDVDYRSS